MCVNLGHLDSPVAQQLAYRIEFHPILHQLAGKRMAQFMQETVHACRFGYFVVTSRQRVYVAVRPKSTTNSLSAPILARCKAFLKLSVIGTKR